MGKQVVKGIGALLASLALLGFFQSVGHITASEEQEMPEELVLDSDVYETNRKGPVTFSCETASGSPPSRASLVRKSAGLDAAPSAVSTLILFARSRSSRC